MTELNINEHNNNIDLLNSLDNNLNSLNIFIYRNETLSLSLDLSRIVLPPNLKKFAVNLKGGVDKLPNLPNGLETFIVESIQIENVENKKLILPQLLPSKLKILTLVNTQLTELELQRLPTGLIEFNCSRNKLTQLPPLPFRLEKFICSDNGLTKLPPLPTGLQIFGCSNNELTTLPPLQNNVRKLPSNLKLFNCSHNKLTKLPPLLPEGLRYFYCSDNELTELPPLPTGLQIFGCSNNDLTTLPEIPRRLYHLVSDDSNIMPNPFNAQTIDRLNGIKGEHQQEQINMFERLGSHQRQAEIERQELETRLQARETQLLAQRNLANRPKIKQQTSGILINTNNEGFDFINQENRIIKDYLAEKTTEKEGTTEKKFVIKFGNDFYLFNTKTIETQFPTSLRYECNSKKEILNEPPLFYLRKIGLFGYGLADELEEIVTSGNQYFVMEESTKKKTEESNTEESNTEESNTEKTEESNTEESITIRYTSSSDIEVYCKIENEGKLYNIKIAQPTVPITTEAQPEEKEQELSGGKPIQHRKTLKYRKIKTLKGSGKGKKMISHKRILHKRISHKRILHKRILHKRISHKRK
jgi:hypothetical protein